MNTNFALHENHPNYAGYSLKAVADMPIAVHRVLPDFVDLCDHLSDVATSGRAHLTALDFMPTFNVLPPLSEETLTELLESQASRHILIDNDFLKVLIIRWAPGEIGDVHPHPLGSGVYKVLAGSLEELRFSTGVRPELLAKNHLYTGSTLYIDDRFGQHAVGNPFRLPALSLHAYVRGQ